MDLPLLFFVASLVLLAIGEVIAFFDTAPGNTLSERIRAWASVAVGRKGLLAAGMILLFTHIVYAWPW